MLSKQFVYLLVAWVSVGCSSSSSSADEERATGPESDAAGSCEELVTCVCGGDTEPAPDDAPGCKNMRTIVEGYRRDYGDVAADSHCAAQLMLAGLDHCDDSAVPSPGAPEEGALIGACVVTKGICVEHYANPNVPGGNGLTTCGINAGEWREGMTCPQQDLLGYCEDNLAKHGQTFYYYPQPGTNETTLIRACETGFHASEP